MDRMTESTPLVLTLSLILIATRPPYFTLPLTAIDSINPFNTRQAVMPGPQTKRCFGSFSKERFDPVYPSAIDRLLWYFTCSLRPCYSMPADGSSEQALSPSASEHDNSRLDSPNMFSDRQ